MVSFLFSLVLVAVNLGEIITIIVPLINDNASPDKQIENNGDKDTMICGHGAETAAVSFSTFHNFKAEHFTLLVACPHE